MLDLIKCLYKIMKRRSVKKRLKKSLQVTLKDYMI